MALWIKKNGKIIRVRFGAYPNYSWNLPQQMQQGCCLCGGLQSGGIFYGTPSGGLYMPTASTDTEFWTDPGDCGPGGSPKPHMCGEDIPPYQYGCGVCLNSSVSQCHALTGPTHECAFNFTVFIQVCRHICGEGSASDIRLMMVHELVSAKEECTDPATLDPETDLDIIDSIPCGCVASNLNIWLPPQDFSCDETAAYVAKFGPFDVDNDAEFCKCEIDQFWIYYLSAAQISNL